MINELRLSLKFSVLFKILTHVDSCENEHRQDFGLQGSYVSQNEVERTWTINTLQPSKQQVKILIIRIKRLTPYYKFHLMKEKSELLSKLVQVETNKYIYLSTVLYLSIILTGVFLFSATLYFNLTTSKRQIL